MYCLIMSYFSDGESPSGLNCDSRIKMLNLKYSRSYEVKFAQIGIEEHALLNTISKDFPNSKSFIFDSSDNIRKHKDQFESQSDHVFFIEVESQVPGFEVRELSKLLVEFPELKFDYVSIKKGYMPSVDVLKIFFFLGLLNGDTYIDLNYFGHNESSFLTNRRMASSMNRDSEIDQLVFQELDELVLRFLRHDDVGAINEINEIRYSLKHRGLSIHTTMSSLEIECLTNYLKASNFYLEFGSGYSTMLAAQMPGLSVISLESDQNYVNFMEEEIDSGENERSRLELIHLNIGPTKEWGWPANTLTASLFPNYALGAMAKIKQKNFTPDLVLIDGRFRVASFLWCCLMFPRSTILFDDYLERDYYHVVEEILAPKKIVGRIAVFIPPRKLSRKKTLKAIELILGNSYDPS
jgi:hypothetical protein